MTIYTIGYQMRDIDAFIKLLSENGVGTLVDVRETPWSHRPGFSRRALEEALSQAGIDYHHAKFAGNPKSLRRSAASHEECLNDYGAYLKVNPKIVCDFDELVLQLMHEGSSICLVCYERHPGDCHRNVLLKTWMKTMRRKHPIIHLGCEGAKRFTSIKAVA